MSQHDKLFIKISTDFHNEINPILKEIDPEISEVFWYDYRNIFGKFFLINMILTSLNGLEGSKSKILVLKRILEDYLPRLKRYFDDGYLATCFVYFAPEDFGKTQAYFDKILEFTNKAAFGINIRYIYSVGIDIIGFPNDCSYKLSGEIKNGKIVIMTREEPFSKSEVQNGKLMYTTSRVRLEQNKIDNAFREKNYDLIKKLNREIADSFLAFCKETRIINDKLLSDFKDSIAYVDLLANRDQNSGYSIDKLNIEPLYNVLCKGGYIKVGLNEFFGIFKLEPPIKKLLWFKSGSRLKFLIDKLNRKYQISLNPNIWGAERFFMPTISADFRKYLSKQGSNLKYISLLNANDLDDELWKILNN